MNSPIFMYTDFGSADMYVGQVKAVLLREAPECAVIDLLNDAPAFDVEASAHLLAALVPRLPLRSVLIGVVDPGVGSTRGAVAVEVDGRWLVGPDNGLFSVVVARAQSSICCELDWLPSPASASFHGRDLFAPAAAAIASGSVDVRAGTPMHDLEVRLGAADAARVIYIDHYGNVITGLRPIASEHGAIVRIRDTAVCPARVFSEVTRNELFWYENSIGLIEVAARENSASRILGAAIGDAVVVEHRYPDC